MEYPNMEDAHMAHPNDMAHPNMEDANVAFLNSPGGDSAEKKHRKHVKVF